MSRLASQDETAAEINRLKALGCVEFREIKGEMGRRFRKVKPWEEISTRPVLEVCSDWEGRDKHGNRWSLFNTHILHMQPL
jgi:hypothetical protein